MDKRRTKWHHAVNSIDALQNILSSEEYTKESDTICAIETDVIFSDSKAIAVLGHPPQTDGDTLELFLTLLTLDGFQSTSKRRILKLDFKSPAAFKASFDLLKEYISSIKMHDSLFINADILTGPGGPRNVFNGRDFIRQALSLSKDITLSLGWTTGGNESLPYTQSMIDEMAVLLNEHLDSNITLAVRATSFLSSWDLLKSLIVLSDPFGLTLWYSMPLGKETMDQLVDLLENTEKGIKNRTYYDVLIN